MIPYFPKLFKKIKQKHTFLESMLSKSITERENPIPSVSQQQAEDKRMFGPVWHGTTSDKKEKI